MITSDCFKFLDFWFYTVGVNICPADTRNKRLSESWKAKQTTAMSVEEYEELKKTGSFIRGAAVITGRVWRGDYVGYYLNGIDLDNSKAIEEICSSGNSNNSGKTITRDELAASTLLEHHPDDPTKLHLYIYSKHPFKNKSSDLGRAWFNNETMPAIEVKGLKCLMFCTPSMHKNGHRYQFVNQRVPGLSENIELIINDVLSKYDIQYLSKDDARLRDTQKSNDDKRTINEGSRHTELLREMNARLHEFIRAKPLEEIRQLCIKFNNLYCRPPLAIEEFERMWNDAISHVAQQEMEKDAGHDPRAVELISVAEAIRRSCGRVVVKGLIIGISSVVQVVSETEFGCSSCGQSHIEQHIPPLFSLPNSLSNHCRRRCGSCDESACYGPRHNKEMSAMTIQLQDEEKQNELESLNVVLFENNTRNVRNGEKAIVAGDLNVVQQRGNNGKRVTYLFAGSIEYETQQNESVVITEEDLEAIDEFSMQPNMITKLVDMLAPTIIGHDDKKLGIILMYVGANETEDFRGRIHGLFIGPPGTAKSKLAQAAKRLGQPHSRYSSTQGASGKSITAIIDKDNDSYVLRNGVLPQAKNSVCILNEIASLTMEDQRHLFDVMEEGKLTLDKYGFHKEIDSPTTILGTTNPESGEWYMDIIDKGQIPLRKELVDRYDLIFIFQLLKDKGQKVEYARKKLDILKNKDIKENHLFLRKVIEHAKMFNPELSEEAEAMIVDYWSRLDTRIFPTNRVFETMIRVSMAFARLHFSDIVTAHIAKEAIDFLTKMYQAFDSSVVVVQDPREATCHEIAKFLMQNPNMPYDFQDCINYAASNNTLVEAYLGKSPVNNNSSKYRDVADRFKQGLIGDGLISIEDMNPLRLMFKPEVNKARENNVL
jgi:DNA replicative helicase MCM subunit Mcm2 (Cdc46/Mcm family)